MTERKAAFRDVAGTLPSTTLLHFIGEAIPERVIEFVRGHRPIRGDEVVTAAILAPLVQRSPTCRVVELVELESSCCVTHDDGSNDAHGIAVTTVGVAICLEHGGRGEVCTVETVADDIPWIHHLLLDALLATEHDEQHGLRWRPPSNASDELALPPNAVVERRIHEMHGALPLISRPTSGANHVGFGLISIAELATGDGHSMHETAHNILAINNAAFMDHPEQGAWLHGDVDALFAEQWFDPRLLVLARNAHGDTIGFAVMKVVPSRAVELYIVAVDPNAARRGNHGGVGRALVLDGFSRAATLNEGANAMLFVDATNERAIALYRSLGFEVVRTQMVVAIHPLATPDHDHLTDTREVGARNV